MDRLVEIPKGDLPRLRDLFRANWSYGVGGYCLLRIQLAKSNLSDILNLKFFAAGGDITHGMVAISEQNFKLYIDICPTSVEGLRYIEDALTNTEVIDWHREVTVAAANSDVFHCLKRLSDKMGLKIIYESRVRKHILEKDAKPFDDIEQPENTYVNPLRPEYLNLVNRTWTFYSGKDSYEYFRNLVENDMTYVLYSSEDHKPVCWIMIDYDGAFSHLYCLGAHRRKGYAEYITKVASNDLLRQGSDVLAYTLENNYKPQNLFSKMGFEDLGYVWWMCLIKEK